MPSSTTYAEFGANTEAVEVAKAFADGIKGKTILVTGVNKDGLGYSAAYAFATQQPANLILTGRNLDKIQICIDAINDEFPSINCRALKVDLSSQASVREAAKEVLAWDDIPAINIVVNSAGVMGLTNRTINKDGIEMHFATNHIGHWLLSCLIMPKLITAAKSSPKGATRIVNVSSGSPTVSSMRWSDMNFEKINTTLPEDEQPSYEWLKGWGYENAADVAYVPIDGYNRSKVANILFGIGATKRLFESHGIFVTGLHPGVIKTELARNFVPETLEKIEELRVKGVYTLKTLGAGSSTALVAALDPKLAVEVGETVDGVENYGAFLADCQIFNKAKKLAVASSEAEKLWELSEKLVGQKFAW